MSSTYRGWKISFEPMTNQYEALHDDYEPEWLGEDCGWQDDHRHRLSADTLDDIMAEINAIEDPEDPQGDY